jgi:nitrate reductase alpha subunit
VSYFDDYVRRYTDLPMLVMLKEHVLPGGETVMVPDRYVRASDFDGKLGQANNPEWKTVAFDESPARWCCPTAPSASAGALMAAPTRGSGTWKPRKRVTARGQAQAVAARGRGPGKETAKVGFPYFGGIVSEHFPNNLRPGENGVLVRTVPVQRISLGKAGGKREALVATVFDLQVANYGVARGLPGELAAKQLRR